MLGGELPASDDTVEYLLDNVALSEEFVAWCCAAPRLVDPRGRHSVI
jgi:hypothetical protein